jgi:hypothetical protein
MVFALRENFVFPISLPAKWSQGKICLEQILAALLPAGCNTGRIASKRHVKCLFHYFCSPELQARVNQQEV